MHPTRIVALSLAICLGLSSGVLPAAELVPPANIDALAQELIDSGWAYGLAIGLIDERGTQTAGYGRMSETDPAVPDAGSVFEIGSITKVFTGLVLAQMVEEKLVQLDEPVQSLLGDSIAVPKGKDREITLVDLSDHASGLPRMPSNFRPRDVKDPYADYSVEQLAEFVGKHKLRREPRVKYEYSNLATGLLGHALALKNNTSYEEMVNQRICKPLGMHDTAITLNDSLRARLAVGHDADGNPAANWHLPTLAGAGALRSTVDDMLKFLAAQIGFVHTPLDAAIAASHTVHFKLPDGSGVALGWHVQRDGVIWHNGGTGGYHAFAGFSPDKKAGVVVLSNSPVSAVDQLGRRLLQLLSKGEAPPLELPRPIALDAAALDRFSGTYQTTAIPKIEVTRAGNALSFHIVGQEEFKLYPKSETDFFTRVSPEVSVSFETADDGAIKQLVIHQGGHDVRVPRAR